MRHCPPIEIVGILVDDPTLGEGRVEDAHELVVWLCLSLTEHADPSTHPTLAHAVYARVSIELQFGTSLLHHRVPAHLRIGDVMCPVDHEAILLNTDGAKLVEDISEDQDIHYKEIKEVSSENIIITSTSMRY